MAALRQGPRSYDFALKIQRHDLRDKQPNSLVQVSSLFAKYRLRGIENFGLRVVGNVSERMTAGGSQDSYAMDALTPLFVYTNEKQTKRIVSQNEDCTVFTRDFGSTQNVKDCSNKKSISWYRAGSRRTLCTASSSHLLQRQVRAYSGHGPQPEPLFKSKTGYYDILEVAPSATQAQIKTAYYKQSFLYHPDRNAGSETATGRFSEISEAYTVLGNKTLRKKYDRGLLSLSDLVGAGCPPGKEPAGSGARPRAEGRRSVMGADGREKIYNFDAFFKSHYQEQLRREKEIRIRRDEFLKHQTETFEEKKLDWLVEMGIGLMVTLAAVLWISMKAR